MNQPTENEAKALRLLRGTAAATRALEELDKSIAELQEQRAWVAAELEAGKMQLAKLAGMLDHTLPVD